MKLRDLCKLIVDCEHKTAPTQETGYPSIRTPNIGRGYFILDGVNRVSEETYRLWTRRAVPQPGDLIMAREAPVGNVAVIPSRLQPCLGQRTLLIRPDRSKVDSSFLNYFLNGPHVQGLIQAKTHGATVAHLNMEDVRTLELPELPPLTTQRRTGEILSAYDDLIENNNRRIKILEEMAQMIYREWFVNFRFPGHAMVKVVKLDGTFIPKGWERSSFGSLFIIKYGKNLPTNLISPKGLFPVYGAGSVIGYFDEKLYERKVCLVTCRGNGSGTVWRTRGPAFVTNNSLMLQPAYPLTDADYPFIKLLAEDANIRGVISGSAQPQITVEGLMTVPAILPERELVTRFVGVVGPMCELVDSLYKKNDNLRHTRDLLLPKLISGEIDVNHFEAESAAQSV